MNEGVKERGVQAPGRNRNEWLEKEVGVLGEHLHQGGGKCKLYIISKICRRHE